MSQRKTVTEIKKTAEQMAMMLNGGYSNCFIQGARNLRS